MKLILALLFIGAAGVVTASARPVAMNWPRLHLHAVDVLPVEVPGRTAGLPVGWRFVGDRPPTRQLTEAMPPPGSRRGGGMVLPVGAAPIAAFQSATVAEIVIGGRYDFDMSDLHDSETFGDITVSPLDHLTVVRFSVKPGLSMSLTREPVGWVVSVGKVPSRSGEGMAVRQQGDGVLFATAHAGQVATVFDPVSGRRLSVGLVGGDAVFDAGERHGVGFSVRPAVKGVVVAMDSDALELRRVSNGFFLGAAGAEALVPHLQAQGEAEAGDRLLAGLGVDDPVLARERARRAWIAASAAAPGARFDLRVRAARLALAAGDDAGARGLLGVALQDDPEGIARPGVGLLDMALRVLGKRSLAERDDVSGDDREARFWRGIAASRQTGPDHEHAAGMIASGWEIARRYPVGLRDRVLPEGAEAIAREGSVSERGVMSDLPTGRMYDLARALAGASDGRADMGALEALSRDCDPVVVAKAREMVIMGEVAKKTLSEAQAVTSLDLLRPSARLAGREREVVRRQFELLLKLGDWVRARRALDDYGRQDVETADVDALRKRLVWGMLAAPQEDESSLLLAAFEVDRLRDDDVKLQAESVLGDRLAANGLADRAEGMWQDVAARAAAPGMRRHAILKRATYDLERHRVVQARQIMDQMPAASPEDDEVRLLLARISLAEGKPAAVGSELAGMTTREAWDARLDADERLADWRAAEKDGQHMLDGLAAGSSPLSHRDQTRVVRICSDASRANDSGLLHDLKARYGGRIDDPLLRPVFDMLTRSLPVVAGSPRVSMR